MRYSTGMTISCGCAVSGLLAAILALPATLKAGDSEKGATSTLSLEILRQKVQANEAKASLIRMEYRCSTEAHGDDPQISQSALNSSEHGSYRQDLYAQDGKRFHLTESTYRERKCVNTRVEVVDGEVLKVGLRQDLMGGWITRAEKFTWGGVEPVRMVFRPYGNRLLMSDCLVPEHASIRQDRVTFNGRDAALVEVKDPQKGPYYMLTWIDLERGLPLRTEHYFPNKDGAGHRCGTVAEPTKFHQLPNGGWIAVEGVMRMHRIREGFTMDLGVFCTVDVNSISIERKDIPDSLFDIKFPPGAMITNEIVGALFPGELGARSGSNLIFHKRDDALRLHRQSSAVLGMPAQG
ncbi:MAG: hypothetical protein KBE65_21455 [Phycisphaerae bacterium]|nr:hypothetical protein [Phycisphaerae bacterium]